jgi:hypothetical protein
MNPREHGYLLEGHNVLRVFSEDVTHPSPLEPDILFFIKRMQRPSVIHIREFRDGVARLSDESKRNLRYFYKEIQFREKWIKEEYHQTFIAINSEEFHRLTRSKDSFVFMQAILEHSGYSQSPVSYDCLMAILGLQVLPSKRRQETRGWIVFSDPEIRCPRIVRR